ncbi:protein BIG GRAIN 1-like A [Impatiens glandulifera]|uniref:protein BIG GRAIN 1-like A n=1 Tax=Impatiens glandulifera TaxID=253017 RepID=UPI001FB078DA|nr:protein BIG GRAIN 1-like A [Impatiens glandulifera]
MDNWEQSLPSYKTRRNPQNISFSSTLLDEIYRSIDGADEFKLHRSRPSTERSKNGVTSLKPNKPSKTVKEEEEINVHSFRREKLKVPPCRRRSLPELYRASREIDFDPVPFSSSSSSSDSSSGGLSSSDVEFIGVAKSRVSRVSCFTVLRPKSVKTVVPSKTEKPAKVSDYQSDGGHRPFDDTDGLIKSKLRALKIYNNVKKSKQQPTSPGSGRLTNFLNSLFSNNGGNPKKTKNQNIVSAETTQPSSTCSSTASYYRSCLINKEKTNGEKKTKVRFDTVNVIVNRDDADLDDESDSSSDLFELDHLAMDKYGEELPVYETTHVHLGLNRINVR